MSQSAVPAETTTPAMMKPMTDMQNFMTDMAKAAPASRMMPPLMAHPTAAVAAATALGFGAASQMMGFWLGSLQGAVDASRRMGLPVVPVDMTAGFKALDVEWNATLGKAVVEATEDALETASGAVAKVAADVSEHSRTSSAKTAAAMRKAEAAAAEMAAVTADAVARATRSAVRQAEPVAARAVTTARAATPAKPAATKAAAPAPANNADSAVKAAAPAVKAPAKTAAEPAKQAAGAPAMTPPKKLAKPAEPDDLKLIAGIGPKLEEVLNKLGIWSFAQIAAWNTEETAWVEDYLQFRDRIDRDGWIKQAKALAKK